MGNRLLLSAILAVIATLALACGAEEPASEPIDPAPPADDDADGPTSPDGEDTDAVEEPEDAQDDPEPGDTSDDGDDGDEAVDGSDRPEVVQARADAAAHTGVDEADVEVVAVEQVTWSDGSLGCPEPGMMYTQALVEGYRITLEAGGRELSYHGADGDEPFRCDDPSEPATTDR